MPDSKDVNASTSAGDDVVAEALSFAKRADELRGKAIKRRLEQPREIENNLKSLGYPHHTLTANGAIFPKTEPVSLSEGSVKSLQSLAGLGNFDEC